MKEKDFKLALDAERRIIHRLLKHPEDFDKMPKKSVVLPKLNIEVPVKSWKEADKIIANMDKPSFVRELRSRKGVSRLPDGAILKKLKKQV